MGLIDQCKVLFKAGDGGNGIVAWRREAHVPLGGPAGGDGGNGGSIIIVGNHNENSLQNLKYSKLIRAGHGEKGSIKTQHGANGNDVYVKVPIGTIITDFDNGKILVDIIEHNQEYVIARGGKGGYGNFHFKSGQNKAPTLYEFGDLGEEKNIVLTLKYIADIGIVGLPNAGKSTFISKISQAKPKMANYQFTTLTPILGTIYLEGEKVVFADIPGLIKGASDGLGLGHDFLKHIERTKVLIHLISMDEDDNDDPVEAYETIMNELEKYSKLMKNKPMIIVANKMDSVNAEERFAKLQKHLSKVEIIKTITLLDENLGIVVHRAFEELKEQKKNIEKSEEKKIYKIEIEKNFEDTLSRELHIVNPEKNYWEVESDFLKYWHRKLPLNTQDNVIRFNQKMQTLGVEKVLKEMGAVKNDTIKIYNISFKFED